MLDEFVAYIGSWEIHDATLQRVENREGVVTVFLKAYEGRDFAVRFHGVVHQEAKETEGMMLYALSELSWTAPLRKFHFLPWDSESPALLEIIAEGVEMLDTPLHAAADRTL